jgi:hypothetical protein
MGRAAVVSARPCRRLCHFLHQPALLVCSLTVLCNCTHVGSFRSYSAMDQSLTRYARSYNVTDAQMFPFRVSPSGCLSV